MLTSNNYKDYVKRLSKFRGQNFLINALKAIEIVEALNISSDDIIYEIGAGIGAISDIIIFNLQFAVFNVIEIDYQLYNILYDKYSKYFSTKYIVLKNYDVFCSDLWDNTRNIKIVSNLPFNIQKRFLSKIICEQIYFSTMVLMMQYEFEEIIMQKTSAFGALVHTMFNIQKVCDVMNTDFFPVPKVNAVVLRFYHKAQPYNINYYQYYNFLRVLYINKRKILSNNVNINVRNEFKLMRAHELSVNNLVQCYLDNEGK